MTEPAELDRLTKLRVAREYLQHQLARLDETIRQAEAEEADASRRRERARREQAWQLEPTRAERGHAVLHRGGCSLYTAQMGLLSRSEALEALQMTDPSVRCCPVCRPETGLRDP